MKDKTLKIFVSDVVGDKGYEEEKYPSPIFAISVFDPIVYSESLKISQRTTYAPNAPSEFFTINLNAKQFA